ncbi:MAG: Co2+/Mg2+ efflux protein ApaG [Bacteroidia bacterium]|nr:MAG: Co2+/Mg2+ efflux protein ApaG [Bacteroidia bacterium]
MYSYTAITEGVQVTVRPVYLDGQSNVLERKFVFAYFITIANKGSVSIQLLRRHWVIRHGSGKIEEVEGEGVVGKQPVIQPGGDHDYNSYCVLDTPEGSMEGTYLMRREDGSEFQAVIPKFNLRAMAN